MGRRATESNLGSGSCLAGKSGNSFRDSTTAGGGICSGELGALGCLVSSLLGGRLTCVEAVTKATGGELGSLGCLVSSLLGGRLTCVEAVTEATGGDLGSLGCLVSSLLGGRLTCVEAATKATGGDLGSLGCLVGNGGGAGGGGGALGDFGDAMAAVSAMATSRRCVVSMSASALRALCWRNTLCCRSAASKVVAFSAAFTASTAAFSASSKF